jgi:DNA polymerase (family X)
MLESKTQVTNEEIAGIFEEIATLLNFQEANPHRIRAFRNGASAIRNLDKPVDTILAEEGIDSKAG